MRQGLQQQQQQQMLNQQQGNIPMQQGNMISQPVNQLFFSSDVTCNTWEYSGAHKTLEQEDYH